MEGASCGLEGAPHTKEFQAEVPFLSGFEEGRMFQQEALEERTGTVI